MTRVFQLQDDVVVCVINYETPPPFIGADPRFIVAPAGTDHVRHGWRYLNGVFLEPLPPSPVSIAVVLSSFQAKTALAQAGLLDAVITCINGPDTPIKIKLAWQEGINFRSDNLMVQWIASKLNLSAMQVNALFIAGSRVSLEEL